MKKLIVAWRTMALRFRLNRLCFCLDLTVGLDATVRRWTASSVMLRQPFGRKIRSRKTMTIIIATAPIMPMAAA